MSRRRNFVNGLKEQAGRVAKGDVFNHRPHGSCMTKERLPPRFNMRGISLAARVSLREIRNFTLRTTGRDACIKESKLRNDAIEKMGINSPCAKTSFLSFASCHSTNLAKTLSPEGADLIDTDYGFRKTSPLNLVTRCVEQCKRDGQLSATPSSLCNFNAPVMPSIERKIPVQKLCRCHASLLDVKSECCNFLGCWEHKGIKEEDLDTFLMENKPYFQKSGMLQKIEYSLFNDNKEWKEFLRNDKCTVFRKQLPAGIYEYRVHASFKDVSASKLFRTNTDGDYRKKWDHYIIDLKIVDSDAETSSDLVQWVTKCPYPFSTREYIYLRRRKVDEKNKAMILFQKATDKTDIPSDPKIMRIDTYLSKTIIKPHGKDFDENGCDYLLSYYDDPKMILPTYLMDLAASRGISDSVKRMHKAALGLES